jgi:hypothetical protein
MSRYEDLVAFFGGNRERVSVVGQRNEAIVHPYILCLLPHEMVANVVMVVLQIVKKHKNEAR